jgi:hypothetical protein
MKAGRREGLEMDPSRVLPALCVVAIAIVFPTEAQAYERQWHVGANVGYIGGWNGIGHGVGGGVEVGYGVRDWLEVVGSVDLSGHPATKILVPSGTVGVHFAFDVLQIVPYIGVMAGGAGVLALGACATDCHAPKLDLTVPFGLDYKVSPSVSIGLGGRFQLLLIGGSPTPMLGAFARAAYVWGF